MGKRNHICDVKDCGRQRQRWQRICTECFGRLPRDVRAALIQAWHNGDRAAWRYRCRQARDLIAASKAAKLRTANSTPGNARPHVTPARAASLMSRILGEGVEI